MRYATLDYICLSSRFMNTTTPLYFLLVDSLSIFFFYKFSLWQKANTHECCLYNLSRKPLFIAPAHSYLSMHCVGYPAVFKFAKVWINLEYNSRTPKVSSESKIERKRKKEYWPITPKVIAMANENNSPSTIIYRWPNVTILEELYLNLLFLLFHVN